MLTGLDRLEYRGYDSCGIIYSVDNSLITKKSVQRIEDLKKQVQVDSNLAIGHTRWATHGGVTLINAHPHTSNNNKFTIVHNGVIDNYQDLKIQFLQNIELKSQTDTEIIIELVNYFYDLLGDVTKSIGALFKVLKGSYSCLILDDDNQDRVYAIKNKTPMLIGKGDGFCTVASDPTACYDIVESFYRLEDLQIAIIKKDEVIVYDEELNVVKCKFEEIEIDDFILEIGNYDHFMLKEIEEQPAALKNLIKHYKDYKIDEELKVKLLNAPKIYIVASGTSHNAGLVGKRIIERDLKIPVEVALGSEFGYDTPLIPEKSVFIFISQSGETADSMVVFNKVVGKYTTLAITNTKGSQLDQRAQFNMLLFAGIEVAVASTKAYTAQIATISILSSILKGESANKINELESIISFQKKIIEQKEEIKKLAIKISKFPQAIIVGRLLDYDVITEASLKIKEVTYININSYQAGELKHGPISLITKDMLVISLATVESVVESTLSNVEEIKARDGVVISIGLKQLEKSFDFSFDYEGDELLSPLVSTIIFQYIAYYGALELNLDVDKPRNLAKSVTVE